MMSYPFLTPDPGAPRLCHTVGSPIGALLLTGDEHARTGREALPLSWRLRRRWVPLRRRRDRVSHWLF